MPEAPLVPVHHGPARTEGSRSRPVADAFGRSAPPRPRTGSLVPRVLGRSTEVRLHCHGLPSV